MIINFKKALCSGGGGGSSTTIEALNIIENGVYEAPKGTAYTPVTVDVPIPEFTTEEKTVSITSNGQTIVDKSADKDGMTKVTVDVNVPIPEPKLQEKTIPEITTNGVQSITPDAGFDGMSKLDFTVNVPQEGGLNWEGTGYSPTDSAPIEQEIQADIDYTKQKYSEWEAKPDKTFITELYYSDDNLIYAPNIDTSKATVANRAFAFCEQLVHIPLLDTSSIIYMEDFINGCISLTKLPPFNMASCESASQMCNGCKKLLEIPDLNMPSVTNLDRFANKCSFLKTVGNLNTPLLKSANYMFNECIRLESIGKINFDSLTSITRFFGGNYEVTTLTDLGGFTGLKIDWNDNYGLVKCPNLTKQSVLNVINDLYDFRANGDAETIKTLQLHSNSLALLSEEEKAIATNKGWNLVS